jgi:tRNA uridine 5-carboxymethylaminomethyl modification enzyme
LRNDNADTRLTPIGRQVGLVDEQRWDSFSAVQQMADRGMALLGLARVESVSALEWMKRPEANWHSFVQAVPAAAEIQPQVAFRIEIQVKYQGYIARQDRQIERFAQLEARLIPGEIDYSGIIGLRNEARQKLARFTPRSLGQALRISGITPADVTVLAIHLDRPRSN